MINSIRLGVKVGANGLGESFYVAGTTTGTFFNQRSLGVFDAFLIKLSASRLAPRASTHGRNRDLPKVVYLG